MDNQETKLDNLLKRTQETTWKPLPDELTILLDVFLPTSPRSTKSKGYVVLSAICHLLRDDKTVPADSDAPVLEIVKIFFPFISTRLGDTIEANVLAGLAFLTALFQVEGQAASAILQRDGVLETIIDAIDIFASSIVISRAVSQLVAQAAGHKRCRAIVPTECVQWLQTKLSTSRDDETRASAAVALIKLSQGAEVDAAAVTGAAKSTSPASQIDALLAAMKKLVLSNPSPTALSDAVEGLAYMSVVPETKEQLSKDTSLLSKLFSCVPSRKTVPTRIDDEITAFPIYGIVTIISNICAYRPRLTEEESQVAKLKRMASAARDKAGGHELEINVLEDDEHVKERCRRLIKAGALDVLSMASKTSGSRATKLVVGRALLSVIEDQQNRGKVLQSGGAKTLVSTIQDILPAPSSTSKPNMLPPLDRAEIEPIQALAKLCITASPVQVFGPNEGAILDAIGPLSIMLQHPSSNLLQRFEALMALTNLSSQSPEAATRTATMDGLLSKVELLMLEDHILVRRAATELVCNLVGGSEEVFNKYGGDKALGSKSKLHVLVALCDVDDLATRRAASGAIATVTSSPDACQILLELHQEKGRVLPILGQLIDPSIKPPRDPSEDGNEEDMPASTGSDPGLIHRGVVCVLNLLLGVDAGSRRQLASDAERLGLASALVRIIRQERNPNNAVLKPATEALKSIMATGVPVTVPP